jgi:hypothetical protein
VLYFGLGVIKMTAAMAMAQKTTGVRKANPNTKRAVYERLEEVLKHAVERITEYGGSWAEAKAYLDRVEEGL